ncbi:MAG: S1C family serine protease [Bacteroidota bacterium]
MRKHTFIILAILIVTPLLLGFFIGYRVGHGKSQTSFVNSGFPEANGELASFQSTNLDSAGGQVITQRHNAITRAVGIASPAVVGINVIAIQEYQYQNPWSQFFGNDPFFRQYFGNQTIRQEVKELGSGFIISPDGYIITNDHVAGNAKTIKITLTNKEQYDAELVGTDHAMDIALLKIKGSNFPYLHFGNSDDVIIGEWAIALGNPFGLFEISDKPTVTVGVISATGMNIRAEGDRFYRGMIQTDASINSGNSGGPLLNALGEVIGVNAVIYTPNQGSVGVGFAIPVNRVKTVIEQLKKSGKIDRDYFTGIDVNPVDDRIARYFGLDKAEGVIISNIARNSPGERAGLKVGDIIVEVNGEKIATQEDISAVFSQGQVGDVFQLKILRDKKPMTFSLKLERRES